MRFNQIEIDFDIHKMIEAERRGFDEPPYVALRRLLKLPEVKEAKVEQIADVGVPWSEDGVVVPHGSPARMEYQRGTQIYEGKFLNGRLVVNGKAYDTLSAAATDLAVTKNGSKTSLNGWSYWKVKIKGVGPWQSMLELRESKLNLAKL